PSAGACLDARANGSLLLTPQDGDGHSRGRLNAAISLGHAPTSAMSVGARLPTPQSRSDAVRVPLATSPKPGWTPLIWRHRSDHHACHLPEEGSGRLIFADASPAGGAPGVL